jgi:hypothetical protein
MGALDDLATTKTDYDANEAARTQLEADAVTARAAYDALGPVSGIPTDAQNGAADTLRRLGMRRQDLLAHRKHLIQRGYRHAAEALVRPGLAPADWLPAPAPWGEGFSMPHAEPATTQGATP